MKIDFVILSSFVYVFPLFIKPSSICNCNYDLVNNLKAYAKILSIRKSYFVIVQCAKSTYQSFTQKFHMKVLSLFLIEVKSTNYKNP